MKKFKLLLLDANIVIHLFRIGIWDRVVEQCDVHLARTVLNEAHFFLDDQGQRCDFDLSPYAQAGSISVFDLEPSDLSAFRNQFDAIYIEQLDDGETESLAYLLNSPQDFRICSADAIVFRVLGALHRRDQGISLEEVLQQIGSGRPLSRQFTKAFRDEWTRKGFEEGMRGIGVKS